MSVIILSVAVDAKTYLRLEAIAAEKLGIPVDTDDIDEITAKLRKVEELAECSVSEEALAYFRDRGFRGDPA